MNVQEIIQTISDRVGSSANVKTIYGDPYDKDGKTIIPVAKVAYGFGSGFGKGFKDKEGEGGEGGGGGGAVMTRPVGFIEITSENSHFVPINAMPKLVGIGFAAMCLGYLFGRWSKRGK